MMTSRHRCQVSWLISYWSLILTVFSAVAGVLEKYLRRELSILELDDAEYFHYKENEEVKFMSTIIEREPEFNYLAKTPIQPIYNLYATTKAEKIRSYLACFDTEVLIYFNPKVENLTPCILVFLSSLRYLAKQVKLKDWEGMQFLVQQNPKT